MNRALTDLARLRWLEQPLAAWLEAGAIFVLSLAAVQLVRRLLLARAARRDGRPGTGIHDTLIGLVWATRWVLLILPALDLASAPLTLPKAVDRALRSFAIVALLVQVALWLSAALDAWVAIYRRRHLATDPNAADGATTVAALRLFAKIGLWAILLLLALDNLGFNVTALVTGLGIGGVAVALALQNVLGDAFASLSIVIDKPFVIGDSIGIGESPQVSGTVLAIGLKTTRLRSPQGEELIFGNGDLLKSRIRNFRRMESRTVVFPFTVAHGAAAEALEALPGLLRAFVEALPAPPAAPQVRFERAHLRGFSPAGIDFELSFTVLAPDLKATLDCQQAIALGVLRLLAEHGLALARTAPGS